MVGKFAGVQFEGGMEWSGMDRSYSRCAPEGGIKTGVVRRTAWRAVPTAWVC